MKTWFQRCVERINETVRATDGKAPTLTDSEGGARWLTERSPAVTENDAALASLEAQQDRELALLQLVERDAREQDPKSVLGRRLLRKVLDLRRRTAARERELTVRRKNREVAIALSGDLRAAKATDSLGLQDAADVRRALDENASVLRDWKAASSEVLEREWVDVGTAEEEASLTALAAELGKERV